MTRISTDQLRPIIDDFADLIKNRRRDTARPTTAVIDFRNDRQVRKERNVYEIPIGILRFRKDNGRIASDVLSYETNFRPLTEIQKEDQETLGKFLLEKDPQKTEELKNSLLQAGQLDPAIITCDGFLINGNRRKLALEMLSKKYPGDERFLTMKVVILPGKGEEGGPPTLKEIEQIENRYQLMSDGKAEYYNFDRALTIRRKIETGMTLEEQLRDDPNCANLSSKDFNKEMKRIADEYLGPLECVDNYLENLGRSNLYYTVSKGKDDREGRWQAFIDYHNNVYKKLHDKKKLIEMGIRETEIGKIEDAAFKIIRKRDISGAGKVHMIMRQLPKLLTNPEAKNAIMKISEIDSSLPPEECRDIEGKEYDLKDIDKFWGKKNEQQITGLIRKAQGIVEYSHITDTPITLLEIALNKLMDDKMDLQAIQVSDVQKVWVLIRNIRDRIQYIETKFYHLQKDISKVKKP